MACFSLATRKRIHYSNGVEIGQVESRTTHRLVCIASPGPPKVQRGRPRDPNIEVIRCFARCSTPVHVVVSRLLHQILQRCSLDDRGPYFSSSKAPRCHGLPQLFMGKNRQEGCQVAIKLRVEHSSWLHELREEWARSFWVVSRDERSETGLD